MTPKQLMALWDRDGYIDRYSGERLIFPGTLRLLSRILPEELPYHKNGKFEECHFMHWELYPSQDHVIPVARGGSIELDNIVTTSMMRNQIKANWLIDEVGWTLKPPGKLTDWDGLKGWFLKMYSSHSEVINNDRGLKKWRELALIGHPYA